MQKLRSELFGRRAPLSKGRQIARIVIIAAVFIMMFAWTAFAEDGAEVPGSVFYGTFWSLVPPLVAIVLALITREVYSSLIVGIIVGGFFYANGNPIGAMEHILKDGLVQTALADSWDMGILVLLVVLGTMVILMNRAGGSAAFGRWAATHIKSKAGAQVATILLGIIIFVDDYFNCLTVGSVMRPVSDASKVSRAKLAYLIDATAAPICIIAPISSWAAAVSAYVGDGQGLNAFIRAIPFNFYAILTIVMMFFLIIFKMEYGPMRKHAIAAENGDIFNGLNPYANAEEEEFNKNGKVIDLIFPIIVLIICCVLGLLYTGGAFSGTDVITAFSDSDASTGLMYGSVIALIITIIYYLIRRSMNFKDAMGSIPEGFKSMVPAILILTFAWTLKAMTDSLGSTIFVETIMKDSGGITWFLPALIFVIAVVISFATGTSWGTFGILIPITLVAFPLTTPLGVVSMSAAMAGAVCGDHCSPISDTTIMASAGAQCDHVAHVSTQLPYALTVAGVSFVSYIIAGLIPNAVIALPIAIVLMIIILLVIKTVTKRKTA
ncbi:MAG: Na+/H+ antiporter NhaC family protein [Parasporobacterium sp.]|nr:Na+/H+ antiporter NhaC family protein [Parasporobacterium sp.]